MIPLSFLTDVAISVFDFECGRSWVRAPVVSNPIMKLVFAASSLSTQF